MLLLVAGFSETWHGAEAIGALLVSLMLAETGHVERIEHLILPFRDFFGAIFFLHFGLTIDPSALGRGNMDRAWSSALHYSGKLSVFSWPKFLFQREKSSLTSEGGPQ